MRPERSRRAPRTITSRTGFGQGKRAAGLQSPAASHAARVAVAEQLILTAFSTDFARVGALPIKQVADMAGRAQVQAFRYPVQRHRRFPPQSRRDSYLGGVALAMAPQVLCAPTRRLQFFADDAFCLCLLCLAIVRAAAPSSR